MTFWAGLVIGLNLGWWSGILLFVAAVREHHRQEAA